MGIYLYMSQYRATKSNFLPPPKKHQIVQSQLKYSDGTNWWLFDKDWPQDQRPQRYKNWALFNSDQWDSNSLIAYVNFSRENESSLPRPGQTFILTREETSYNMVVINSFPSKRVCRTYVLQVTK